MMPDVTVTETTCASNCWYAREIACRCSCGGKNHGSMMVGEAKQPLRTSRKQGVFYELDAVVDGKRAARRYRQARGVYDIPGHDRTLLILEPGVGKKWSEVRNAGMKRPYLVWRKQGVLFDDPPVCSRCGREDEPHRMAGGSHPNQSYCDFMS